MFSVTNDWVCGLLPVCGYICPYHVTWVIVSRNRHYANLQYLQFMLEARIHGMTVCTLTYIQAFKNC